MQRDSPSTRWTVILGAARGRPLARSEFALRYDGVIRAYLRTRWRESSFHTEIEDAVQDVFFECFKDDGALTRADPANRGGFRTYLFAVVRNVARRIEQKRQRHPEQRADTDLDLPAREEPANRAFDRAWAESIMAQASQRMAERSRGRPAAERRVELLRLRFSDGKSTRHIAEEWGMKPAQVQYEYKCARDEFQAALIEVVREHDPGGDPADECVRLLGLLG